MVRAPWMQMRNQEGLAGGLRDSAGGKVGQRKRGGRRKERGVGGRMRGGV